MMIFAREGRCWRDQMFIQKSGEGAIRNKIVNIEIKII